MSRSAFEPFCGECNATITMQERQTYGQRCKACFDKSVSALTESELEILRACAWGGGYAFIEATSPSICAAADLLKRDFVRPEKFYEGPVLYLTDRGKRAAVAAGIEFSE